MPNRLGRRKTVGRLQLFDQPVRTYSTWLLPDVPGEPAFHSYSSVLWQIVKGTGWVVYQQKDDSWTLAYLWPKQNWYALVDHAYFFLPATPMRCEVTCFEEQFHFRKELIPTGKPVPENVNIHLRGEVTLVGEKWFNLTNEYTTSRIPLTPEERDEMGGLEIGTQRKIIDDENLADFFARLPRVKKFDPRIIYPFRQTAGSDTWLYEEDRLCRLAQLEKSARNS